MRTRLTLWLIPLLLMSFWVPAAAKADLVCDAADVLTHTEKAELEAMLYAVSARNSFDVAVLLVNDYENTPEQHGKLAYQAGEYGADQVYGGVLLVVKVVGSEQTFYVEQTDDHPVLTNRDLRELEEAIEPLVQRNAYYEAIASYAELCDDRVTTNRLFPPIGMVEPPEWYYIPIALGLGMIPAILIVVRMASKLKTVRRQPDAVNYLREDSLRVTERSERVLF